MGRELALNASEGWSEYVLKRGPTRKHAWKKRYLVVRGGLAAYHKKQGGECVGGFALSDVEEVFDNSRGEPPPPEAPVDRATRLVFAVNVRSGTSVRCYLFCALTEAHHRHWVAVFRQLTACRAPPSISSPSPPTASPPVGRAPITPLGVRPPPPPPRDEPLPWALAAGAELICIYDFTPDDFTTQLALEEGQLLVLLSSTVEDGWIEACFLDEPEICGLVPLDCCEPLTE